MRCRRWFRPQRSAVPSDRARLAQFRPNRWSASVMAPSTAKTKTGRTRVDSRSQLAMAPPCVQWPLRHRAATSSRSRQRSITTDRDTTVSHGQLACPGSSRCVRSRRWRGALCSRSSPAASWSDLPPEHHGVVFVRKVVAVRHVRPHEGPEPRKRSPTRGRAQRRLPWRRRRGAAHRAYRHVLAVAHDGSVLLHVQVHRRHPAAAAVADLPE